MHAQKQATRTQVDCREREAHHELGREREQQLRRASLPSSMLGEPERIAIGIVHVKLARAPTLINRAFMHVLWSVRIPGRAQPSLPKLAEDRVNVVSRNDNRLTKLPVATVAGEEESISVARQPAEGRVREIVIAIDALEIEHTGVERKRRLHVAATNSRNNRHMTPNRYSTAEMK
jgi:hypothetical protein